MTLYIIHLLSHLLGLYDNTGDNEDWVWPDGTSLQWSNWQEYEPNYNEHRCVAMNLINGWFDLPCSINWPCSCAFKPGKLYLPS